MINAILLDEKDNVVTCVKEIRAGEEVCYRTGTATASLTAREKIPRCHKVALADLREGDRVLKYGEMIGRLSRAVAAGCWVNEHNLYSVPRDYDSELV